MHYSNENSNLPLTRFESMLKTNSVYFFDSNEFEEIVHYYIDFGKHSLAKKAVKLGLEQHPTSIKLKLLKSELLIFENKFKEAERLLDRMYAIEPNNEEIFIQKASILSKHKEHEKAIDLLKQALVFANEDADILALIGMEYLFLDNFDKARHNFAKCLEVDYDDYSSLYNVIYCFDMQEQHQEAIEYLESYIDKDPYSEVAWHQLGRQHAILKDHKNALRAYDYAILIDETFVGAYLEKAKTLEQVEDYLQAIENYLITTELDDPTSFAYLRIGECYEKLYDFDLAVQYYLKTVNEDPLLDKGWLALSSIYFKQQDYQKALYYINKALETDETNSKFWRKYAGINLKLSLFEETAIAFKKCIDLNDTDLEIWISLADVQHYLGDFNDAIETLERAQLEYKGFSEIEYRLFGIYATLNEHEKALKHLKKALSIDFEYHKVMVDVFPSAFKLPSAQQLIKEAQA